MPVFLSHRTADDAIARRISDRLYRIHGIACYVDDFDKEANSPRRDKRLTEIIMSRLEMCTHMLALVTANTQGSWWVPFEVGVARRAPRIISTFSNLVVGLPEYLTDWPVLRGDDAVDKFAAMYKQQQAGARVLLEKRASAADQLNAVDQFHARLKALLGQP